MELWGGNEQKGLGKNFFFDNENNNFLQAIELSILSFIQINKKIVFKIIFTQFFAYFI